MTERCPAELLARLPADDQGRLRAIAGDSKNLIGGLRDFQSVFDAHLVTFERLRQGGLTHSQIARLLAAVGITRADGGPLTRGTLSSGLSRARERAGARKKTVMPDHGSLFQN